MAVPACLRLADDVFPRVRQEAARRLVAQGWSQQRTGALLGVSQATVSKLLAVAPAAQDLLVDRLADEFVQEALSAQPPAGQPSPWCATLTTAQEPEAGDALQDLLAAEALLKQAGPLRAMPQVGLNLARALPGAQDPTGVLAYPGRLVDVAGRLVSPAPPAPGGSGHLARCLLLLRKERPGLSAIGNVRGGAATMAAARRCGWLATELSGRGDVEARFARACARAVSVAGTADAGAPVLLHEPGAPGLEPCLYVSAPDARGVARAILAIDHQVTP